MKVHEALRRASSYLEEHNREGRAAEILLCHHLGLTRTKLFQMMREPIPEKVCESFMADVERHASGVPVQHLTGEEQFYGRPFMVNRDVLIPRPETEELVATVLQRVERFAPDRDIHVVDVGTGSGAIAVTLALENPRLCVSAVDVSEAALTTAKQNAKRLKAHVDFYQGDLLTPWTENGWKADVIVSNPPYIPDEELLRLDPLVADHDPRLALAGGEDGLDVYRRLAAQLPEVLHRHGFVAFEIGVGQSEAVSRLIKGALGPNVEISIKKDINGKERIVLATV